MSYKVHIIDRTTGEERVVQQTLPWNDSSYFWWTEGNFGCDCNRGNEFLRAKDPDAKWSEFPCNHVHGDRRFQVTHAELSDGTIITIDGPVEAPKL